MQHDSAGEGSSAFVKLKPFCMRLIKDQSRENVVALRRALEQLENDSLQNLHEYVLFPLTLVLQNAKRTEALVIETIECICDMLPEVRVSSWEVFSDLFLRLLVVVSSVKDGLGGAASRVPRIQRTDGWVKSTAEKLSILVHRVCPCLASCEPKTKMAALDWARVSLISCKRSLGALASPLLQLTLTLSSDDDQEVAAKSSSLLDEVAEQMAHDTSSLIEILEEDFYRALGKCPHVIWTGSDVMLLTDVLHQKIQESATQRKQAILVLNNVLLAFRDRKSDISESDETDRMSYLR
ncbi:hypothetical protein IscW_ISCW020370 [Ixodes scapularis]|uniref:TTI1 N-terminal TPR domain-containing protein n=1 Tax=Ixodes scapularis TaxID=6945 RepID=B7Q1T4_IXOSC|nr:hypothetical protein IscW_ISCW020370 [Ixodes scapularis]|eukprot:XP_002410094.1 hypothetical protein IscW_ISCW020370 [Ixodes scapularis]